MGNLKSCLPDGPLDKSRRPTGAVSSISSSTRTGSWKLDSATGLDNQGRVNGQEEGQGKEIKNQSESTHGLKGKLQAKFPQKNQRTD